MKKIFLAVCFLTTTFSSFAIGEGKDPSTEVCATYNSERSSGDCVVTLSERNDCANAGKVIECYSATWDGGSKSFQFVYLMSSPYGSSDGYKVCFTDGQGRLNTGASTYGTKKEAISDFVHTQFGSSCKYVYE